MKTSKSVVILTNFWDANLIIDYGFALFRHKNNVLCKVNIHSKKGVSNYSVHSIAISHPPLTKLENLEKMSRLDFFCPTYDMLVRYKKDSDWEKYTTDYGKLLKSRRSELKDWMDSLKPERVYILCCWENTSSKANCHRELIYKIFLSSEVAKKKIIPVYRHGNKIYKDKKTGAINMPVSTPWALRNRDNRDNYIPLFSTEELRRTTNPITASLNDGVDVGGGISLSLNENGELVYVSETGTSSASGDYETITNGNGDVVSVIRTS